MFDSNQRFSLDENDGKKKEKIETTPKNIMAKETHHMRQILLLYTVWERKW